MKKKYLRIGLASLKLPESIPQGVAKVITALEKSALKDVEIVCFPETYIPGLRGMSHIKLLPPDQEAQERALKQIQEAAAALV